MQEQSTNEDVEKIQKVIQDWIDGTIALLEHNIRMTNECNVCLCGELHSAEAAYAMWFNTESLIKSLKRHNAFPGKSPFKLPKDVTVWKKIIKLDSADSMLYSLKKTLKMRILEQAEKEPSDV